MPLYCDGDENATCKYAFALSRPHLNVCIWWYIVLRWHFFSCHYISKTIMWKPANFTFSFIFFMFITKWLCFVFVTISSVRLTSNHCCLLERSWVWRLFFFLVLVFIKNGFYHICLLSFSHFLCFSMNLKISCSEFLTIARNECILVHHLIYNICCLWRPSIFWTLKIFHLNSIIFFQVAILCKTRSRLHLVNCTFRKVDKTIIKQTNAISASNPKFQFKKME